MLHHEFGHGRTIMCMRMYSHTKPYEGALCATTKMAQAQFKSASLSVTCRESPAQSHVSGGWELLIAACWQVFADRGRGHGSYSASLHSRESLVECCHVFSRDHSSIRNSVSLLVLHFPLRIFNFLSLRAISPCPITKESQHITSPHAHRHLPKTHP